MARGSALIAVEKQPSLALIISGSLNRYRGHVLAGFVLSLVTTGISMVLIVRVPGKESFSGPQISWTAIYVLASLLAYGIIAALAIYNRETVKAKIAHSLRVDLAFRQELKDVDSVRGFDSSKFGRLSTDGADAISHWSAGLVTQLLGSAVTLIVLLGYCLVIDYRMVIFVALLISMVIAVISRVARNVNSLKKYRVRELVALETQYRLVKELHAVDRSSSLTGISARFLAPFIDRVKTCDTGLAKKTSKLTLFNQLCIPFLALAVTGYISFMTQQGILSPRDIGQIGLCLAFSVAPATTLLNMMSEYSQASAEMSSYRVLSELPASKFPSHGGILEPSRSAEILAVSGFATKARYGSVRTESPPQVNLSIARCGVVCLQGPSGIGKTSLLEGIIGLHAHVGSRALRSDCRWAYLPQNIGVSDSNVSDSLFYLCQVFDVDVNLWMRNLARFGLLPRQDPSQNEFGDLSVLVEEVCNGVNSGHPSRGEIQRMYLSAVLASDCDLIALDEPTASLDDDNVDRAVEMISGTAARGKGVIIITHSDRLAESFNNSIYLARKGL